MLRQSNHPTDPTS